MPYPRLILLFWGLLLLCPSLLAQNACVPDSSVADNPGIYPNQITVIGCQAFDTTVTFVFPRDTTVTFAGQTVTVDFVTFTIDSLVGLPAGVSWECDLAPDCRYVVSPDSSQIDTTGCLRLFGLVSAPAIYNLQVFVTAEVDVLGNVSAQPTIFDAPFIVNPCPFEGDCYTLDFLSTCEPSMVEFTNNVPSQGKPGFSYQWDITGPNGFSFQSTDETPSPQVWPEAGDYTVSYAADVDTTGFILNSLSIDAVGCSDLLDDGDLYWILIDPSGTQLVNTSSAPLNNGGGNLPVSTGISNLLLDTGTYEFQVWDNDLIGADDGCATGAGGTGASIFFSIPSSQTGSVVLTEGSLQITLGLQNPIQSISCQDTFSIDPLPAEPSLRFNGDRLQEDSLVFCVGGGIWLEAQSEDSLIWFQNGSLWPVPNSDSVFITEAGDYLVEAINQSTLCSSSSRVIRVDSFEVFAPQISLDSTQEVFTVVNPSDSVSYSWVDANGTEVGTGPEFDPDSNGLYFVIATDTLNGCESPRSEGIDFVSGLSEISLIKTMNLFPNPNQGDFAIEISLQSPAEAQANIYDLRGRKLWQETQPYSTTELRWELSLSQLPAGFYLVQVEAGGQRLQKKLIIQR